jgi:hypothetical protein
LVCSRYDPTAGAGSLTTVHLLRRAIYLNASADMLKHVGLGFPTLDLAGLM